MNSNLLNDLKEKSEKLFNDRIVSLLVYGSILHGNNNSDLDILIILRDKSNPIKDLDNLKIIRNSIDAEDIDLQLFYEEEVKNPKIFSLDAHGSFFVEILKQAKVLIGTNPCLNIDSTTEGRQISTVNKVQNYIFRVRQEAIGIGRHSKDRNPLYHKKKILRVIDDILIFDGILEKRNLRLQQFVKHYRNILTESELEILSNDSDYELSIYITIYEKLYSLIINKSNNHIVYPELSTKRTRFGDIVSEYICTDLSNTKAVIVLEGFPSVPDGKRIMNILANQGFTVFYPRFKGTWESEGEFLLESPVEDLKFIISMLEQGITLKENHYKSTEIYIVASSFGGSVALCLSDVKNIKKIIALSPVYDYKEVPGLETLFIFIRKMFAGAYRFKENNWNKLLSGKLINPLNAIEQGDNSKISILCGKKDEEISADRLIEIGQKYNIPVKIYKDIGHISYSKVKEKILDDIIKILNS